MTCLNPYLLHDAHGYLIAVRCGHCLDCCLAKAREWTCRLLMEYSYNRTASFITLTYDDEHLKGSLSKADFQKYNKRLRHYSDFRFFGVGEYGGQTARPHYHEILFGLDFQDVFSVERLAPKRGYYVKDFVWRQGFVHCDYFNPSYAAYICGYVVSKCDEDKKRLLEAGREPSFQLMSRRPGLGVRWMQEHQKDALVAGFCRVGDRDFAFPRYFRENFMTDGDKYRYKIQSLKWNRQIWQDQLDEMELDKLKALKYRDDVRKQHDMNLRKVLK